MSFADDLADLGFELVQADRGGTQRYAMKSNPYLQWWVFVHPDQTAELQFELELGQYLKEKGFHVSVQDELSLLLFPRTEIRGPADGAWLRQEMERAAERLDGVDLLRGT